MSKKSFIGTVVSNKTKNSVVVAIERKVIHPKYGKLLKKTKRIMADTSSFTEGKNGMEIKLGDIVKIEETRPISKNKNFKVVNIENKK